MSASPRLNISQLEAVHCVRNSTLVIAGAGSGKTRVITQKMAHLIQTGLAPESIAAITFTNKAAAEMRERTRHLVGKQAGKIWISTFHALGVRLLREDGAALGLKPNFSILAVDDVTGILKDAGGSTDRSVVKTWQWQISQWKSEGLDAQQALAASSGDPDALQAAQVMVRYEERLLAYQSVDFDDLINLPLTLLRDHEGVRSKWQRYFRHILVDEYQDTSVTQYELLRLLTGEQSCFTCVGDDDQSIYAWRGATLDNLKRLPIDYPELRVITLEQNYRSVTSILNAANQLIGGNPKLYPKRLWSELGAGTPIRIIDADNEEHEAERVVRHIENLQAQGEADFLSGRRNLRPAWSDYAILYRANHLARVFEQVLRKSNIPYKVSGGTSFFERTEIRDLCAWLRLISNEDDDPAFVRAVSTPKRGIGHTSIASLGKLATTEKSSLFSALFSPLLSSVLRARALTDVHEFGRYINEMQYEAKRVQGQEGALAFLQNWLKDIAYERHLHDNAENDKAATQRWGHVTDFIEWMARRCGGQREDENYDPLAAPEKNLLEVIQQISLISTLGEREGDKNVLTLSTLHAAKGLEWPHVALVGVIEGVLPFSRDAGAYVDDTEEGDAQGGGVDNEEQARNAQNQLEEERRLAYVGITRAQYSLLISWPKTRKKGRERVRSKPSRFIEEMQAGDDTPKENPRERLRLMREQILARQREGM